MLAATPAELAERRAAMERSPVLGGLATRLRALLAPLLEGPVYLPDRKALLSRDGGVCGRDGARLEFDPLSPHEHRCPRCGERVTGERHHRAWITRYHLWLSERAVHLALLHRLRGESVLRERAALILQAYAARYRDYPNRDNVLGPSRLFFSTYLESIWLCQVAIAASLLEEERGSGAGLDPLRAVVAESAGLIASFDEGWSNRQVWNNAALIAAGRWLGAADLVTRGREGPHGVRAQLAHAVTSDGLWFEGENYHFFAARGMLLAAELLRRDGTDLYADRATRGPLGALYEAPLQSLLPDLTLPARSDAPYGISVLQPRFAEFWEIGRTRTGSRRLSALLAHLYAANLPEGDDGGLAELAEQERNRPPARLHRDRLGWKPLLWMEPADPAPGEWRAPSALLADAGLAVLRDDHRYVSLECGGRPGGHGHPDLLHLTLFWDVPWLADPGTGSYVSPSLHWYRSTLAHNAPGLAGVGQLAREGWCAAFDHDGPWAWCRGVADELFGAGSRAVRTLVSGPAYVLDVLDIDLPAGARVDLAIHPIGALALPPRADRGPAGFAVPGAAGHEHGYDALLVAARVAGDMTRWSARSGDEELWVWLVPRQGEALYVAGAPGPPDLDLAPGPPLEFLVRRAAGAGRWIQVYARGAAAVESVEARGDEIRVRRRDRAADAIRLAAGEVRIVPASGTAVVLRGSRQRSGWASPSSPDLPTMPVPLLLEVPALERWDAALPARTIHRLGAVHYRRSEEPYVESAFAARVAAFGAGKQLCMALDVEKPVLVIRAPDAPGPGLDNETPDIHADGVQFYVGHQGWQGFLLLPDPDSSRVYIRPIKGTAGDATRVTAVWERTPTGYRMLVCFDLGRRLARGDRLPINLVINQMLPGRERRAGQLALSGGGGWVYLRGDRESPESAVVAVFE